MNLNRFNPIFAKIKYHLYHWCITDGYIYDWFVALFIIRINRMYIKPLPYIQRYYRDDDPTIGYPLVECAIGHDIFWNLVLYGPALFVILLQLPVLCWSFWTEKSTGRDQQRENVHYNNEISQYDEQPKRSWGQVVFNAWVEWHHVQLTLIESYAIACSIKHIMEHSGKFRPNWLARLASEDPSKIEDGRSSYPSGHALYPFMTCSILTLYLIGKMKILAHARPGQFLLFVIAMSPTFVAVFVSLCRVVCYDHDYSDSLAGGIVGTSLGIVSYFMNFGSLTDIHASGVPHLRQHYKKVTNFDDHTEYDIITRANRRHDTPEDRGHEHSLLHDRQEL